MASATRPDEAPTPSEPELVDVEPTITAVVRATVPSAELPAFFDTSFRALGETLAAQGVTPTGPAFAHYLGMPAGTVELEVGFPVANAVTPAGEVAAGSRPGGRVGRVVHAGSFETLSTSWERLRAFMHLEGLQATDDFWEVYLTEPSPEMDPADLRTELVWPISPSPRAP